MSTLLLLCSVIGGTLLLCQTVLTLIGIGGDHDVGGGHDGALDDAFADDAFGGDAAADAGGELVEGHDFAEHGDVAGHAHDGHHGSDRGSSSFFGILSFRTLVAALTFFGLGGLAGQAAGLRTPQYLLLAVGSGALALYVVHQTMRAMSQLREDGTVRLRDAVGCHGSVYLRIPPASQGVGKIHVVVRNRTVELGARSAEGEIPTGKPISVVRVLGPNLVEVAPRETTAA